jgi:cellulose synthase/poly-beta-1,6-N-acetylglucosamine synthase-like glycosyltransferase
VTLADTILTVAAIPVVCLSSYLFLLALFSKRLKPLPPGTAKLFFDVVVPAHSEEAGIGATLQSLLSLDYPGHLFRVLVVAHNCTDQTAARAQTGGATVLVLNDPGLRGKGHALSYAYAQSLAEGRADAIAVVDADTTVSPNLLRAFASRIERGASAVQADYGVQNPDVSWRTRLLRIAFGMFHVLRSLARERLGLSCGLRGNGMCFTTGVLRAVPHRAFSLVEDVEYGVDLGTAGFRVHYAPEAHVYGEMVSLAAAARPQRRRWEHGRRKLAIRRAPQLFTRAVLRRDKVLLDLGMDLICPPLSSLMLAAAIGAVASLALSINGAHAIASLPVWIASLLFLGFYVLRGWALSSTGAWGLLDLVWAPAYMLWKLTLLFSPSEYKKDEWLRTMREQK